MGWGLLLASALGLYLFENGAGTRLLLAAVIALPLCSALALWLSRPKLAAELRLPARMERGRTVQGTLVLKNASKLPIARVMGRVELAHALTGERTAVSFSRGIGAGGTVSVAFTLSAAHSGRVDIKVAGIQVLDPFGLFARAVPYEAGASVLVMPDLRPVGASPNDAALSDSQGYSLQRAGNDPSETFRIREYVPGDPIRQIHWKLSQKTGQLLVRELGLPIEDNAGPLPEDARGLTCEIERGPTDCWPALLWRMGLAAALYTALWGAVCGMAGVDGFEALTLLPGAALAAALPALSDPKRRRRLWMAALALTAVLCLLRWQTVSDGAKLLLNRLFAASEARQAYAYDRFVVSAPEGDRAACIGAALLALGLPSGCVCGCGSRRERQGLALIPFLALAAGAAYLGVAPGAGWCVLLAACLAAAFLDISHWEWGAMALGALAAVCAVVLLAFPGEDPKLSAWEDGMRDTLAFHTAIQAPQQEEGPDPQETQAPENQTLYESEDAQVDFEGGLLTWARPLSALLILLLLTAVLFGPSIASDQLKKRRAGNRQGLDDPDNSAAIRAAFLYALRWLRLGGVALDNVPFSRYAPQVGEMISPALQARFEEVLPLWQEAAYSTHAMDSAQRDAMLDFAEEVRQAVWAQLGKRERFRARYIDAL